MPFIPEAYLGRSPFQTHFHHAPHLKAKVFKALRTALKDGVNSRNGTQSVPQRFLKQNGLRFIFSAQQSLTMLTRT